MDFPGRDYSLESLDSNWLPAVTVYLLIDTANQGSVPQPPGAFPIAPGNQEASVVLVSSCQVLRGQLNLSLYKLPCFLRLLSVPLGHAAP